MASRQAPHVLQRLSDGLRHLALGNPEGVVGAGDNTVLPRRRGHCLQHRPRSGVSVRERGEAKAMRVRVAQDLALSSVAEARTMGASKRLVEARLISETRATVRKRAVVLRIVAAERPDVVELARP